MICSKELSAAVADLVFEMTDEQIRESFEVADQLNINQMKQLQVNNFSTSHANYPSVESDGCCGSANPIVPPNVAPIVLVMDIFLPGVGTIIAAYYDPSGCNCRAITSGIFQMLLTLILVGWIWSICQGHAIYAKSNDYWAKNAFPPVAPTTLNAARVKQD